MARASRLRQRRIFARFLVSYAFVLLIPLSLGSLAYLRAVRFIESRTEGNALDSLESRVTLLEQRFQEVEAQVNQLALDAQVGRLLTMSSPFEDGRTTVSLLAFQEDLAPYRVAGGFVRTIQILFRKGGFIVSPFYVFSDMSRFYGSFFAYQGLTAEEWFEKVYGSYHQRRVLPAAEIRFGDVTERCLTYLQSLPLERFLTPAGTVAVYFPEAAVLQHFAVFPYRDARLAIIDRSGTVLVNRPVESARAAGSGTEEIEIDDLPTDDAHISRSAHAIVFQSVSAYTGFRYYVIAEPTAVGDQFGSFVQTTWYILVVAAAVGLAGAYLMANRSAKPIAGILSAIGETRRSPVSTGDDFPRYEATLESARKEIELLVTHDRELQEMVAEQLPLLRATFVRRLIEGEFRGRNDIDAQLQQLQMIRLSGKIVVLVAGISHRSSRSSEVGVPAGAKSVQKALLRRIVRGDSPEQLYLYDPDLNTLVAVRQMSSEEAAAAWTASVEKELVGRMYGGVVAGVGLPVDTIEEVCDSYRTARLALEYKPIDWDHPVVRFGSIPAAGRREYPADVEEKILAAVRSGDGAGAKELLDEVYMANFGRRQLSLEERVEVLHHLRETGVRLIEHYERYDSQESADLHRFVAAYESASTIASAFEALHTLASQLVDLYDDRKRSHNLDMRDRIIDHLNENYADSSLYLPTVAEAFGITKQYLSQFFREQTGLNFSTYLERLRVTKACELMAEDDLPISTVAEKVGYNSPHVFRRAFKRVKGIAPSSYVGPEAPEAPEPRSGKSRLRHS